MRRSIRHLMWALPTIIIWVLAFWPQPTLAEQPAAGKYAPAPKAIDGWVDYKEPIPPGKERDPKYSWLPKGPYPYKPSWPRKGVPYTGEELRYFADQYFWAGKYSDYVGLLTLLNKRGLVVNKHFYILRNHYWDTYQDNLDYDEGNVKLHTPMFKAFTIMDLPPENRGFAQLTIKYLNAPGKWKDPDRYNYIPSLRRVRRSAGGDRQDDTLGTLWSNDDNGERQVWEEDHYLVGEDVLCELNAERGTNLLGDPKVIVDDPMNPGAWGEGQNPYREDNCIECWVVKSVHRDPNYYLGYRLGWMEKQTKTEVRWEQYDRHGEVWKTTDITWRLYPGGHQKGGWARTTASGWDLKRDFRAFIWYGDWVMGKPTPESKYSTSELTKELFWRPSPGYRFPTSINQFPPHPAVLPEKVSVHRKGIRQVEPGLLKKVTDNHEMWRKRGGFDAWAWAKRTKFQDVK